VKPKVFISHSSIDSWVARQLATHLATCGVDTVLDNADIDHGDDFEESILKAAEESSELLVLLTPWSVDRPYIWMEIGNFWGRRKRMIGLLYGLTVEDVSQDERMPVALKRLDLVQLNEVDSYFVQLARRVTGVRF
jgi:TIR domain-containing protein